MKKALCLAALRRPALYFWFLCAGQRRRTGGIHPSSSFTGDRYQADLWPLFRWGIAAFASSLIGGPITRDVRDCAIMLKSLASYDAKDSTSVDVPVPDYGAIDGSLKGKVIGIRANIAWMACRRN